MSTSSSPDCFNVLTGELRPVIITAFGNTPAEVRVLHLSDDHRQLVAACRYPSGASVTSVGDSCAQEVFYVAAGAGSRTFDDGRVLPMVVGDLVFVRPGERVRYDYDPGFTIVVHFWSPTRLPDTLFAALGPSLVESHALSSP